MRGEMVKTEIDLQHQLNGMKKQAADADRERNEVLAQVDTLKDKMQEQYRSENIRHNYVYH